MSIEFVLPELGEDVTTGDMVNVLVREGEVIEPGQMVFELETNKAVVEVPCPDGGKITKVHVNKGDTVEVGQVLLTLEAEQQAAVDEEPAPAAEAAVSERPHAEPGRDAWGPVHRERLSRIRRTIADQMVRSAATIPHVTNFDDADVTELEHLRKKEHFGADLKLTMTSLVMKAVANALGRHPMLRASLDEDNDQVVHKQYVHLGVAVDTPRGLVVPVVRDVDRMTIVEIARAIGLLAERVRSAQFEIEELRGGCFTVSNMGAVGGTYSTPIINHPEVAILSLGRSRRMPVVRGGEITIRWMLPLSLSYDHRLVDGATATRFLDDVIDNLQSPGNLLPPG